MNLLNLIYNNTPISSLKRFNHPNTIKYTWDDYFNNIPANRIYFYPVMSFPPHYVNEFYHLNIEEDDDSFIDLLDDINMNAYRTTLFTEDEENGNNIIDDDIFGGGRFLGHPTDNILDNKNDLPALQAALEYMGIKEREYIYHQDLDWLIELFNEDEQRAIKEVKSFTLLLEFTDFENVWWSDGGVFRSMIHENDLKKYYFSKIYAGIYGST